MKAVYFISLLLTAAPLSVFATPHAARGLHNHHRAIAARVASPADVPSASMRKRASGRRCRPRSSSAAPAPATTTKPVANVAPTPDVEDKPTTTKKADPTTTKEATTSKPKPTPTPTPTPAKPAENNDNSGSGGARPFGDFFAGQQTGEGTFYATGLTACGETNKDTDFICAVSMKLFDAVPGASGNPNNNPICGKKIKATYKGKSVTVRVTDRCVGCAPTDLDFSPSAFAQLASFDLGRLQGVTWTWV
ncbi:Plant Cell Wall Expansin [Pleurotus pulmonarius]